MNSGVWKVLFGLRVTNKKVFIVMLIILLLARKVSMYTNFL